MAIDRRNLFTAAAALGVLSLSARASTQKPVAAEKSLRIFSGTRVNGMDGASLWHDGALHTNALPGRAHAMLDLQDGRVLFMGRRPGTFAAFTAADGAVLGLFAPLKGKRFAGHAARVSRSRFVTSEIDAETAVGSVVLRDANGVALQEYRLGGIEPHDLVFADGRLVVALGGIANDASVKGPAINAGRIDSQLVELNVETGRVLARHRLGKGLASLSMRHLSIAANGAVVFGMQDQDKSQLRPLMGRLHEAKVELFSLPEGDEKSALRFYIGSVAVDSSSHYVAATSPKGGVAGLWSLANGKFLSGLALTDICGLAAGHDQTYWATSGMGNVVKARADEQGFTLMGQWHADAAFDNHLALGNSVAA